MESTEKQPDKNSYPSQFPEKGCCYLTQFSFLWAEAGRSTGKAPSWVYNHQRSFCRLQPWLQRNSRSAITINSQAQRLSLTILFTTPPSPWHVILIPLAHHSPQFSPTFLHNKTSQTTHYSCSSYLHIAFLLIVLITGDENPSGQDNQKGLSQILFFAWFIYS